MKDITFLVYNPTITDLEIDKEDMRTLMSDLNKNNFYHIDERGRSLYFLDLVQLAIFLRCMISNPMGLLKFVDDSGLKSSESTINRLFKDSMDI